MARFSAAPAVSLREVNGAWWLVTPAGELFVSLGLNGVQAPAMLTPRSQRHTLNRYGEDFVGADGLWNPAGEGVRRWLGHVRKEFQQWGFNTFGYHTVAPREQLGGGLYYVCQACGQSPSGYPDLFSAAFVADLDRRLSAVCAEARSDAACLGYAFADQPPWQETPLAAGLHPWVRQLAEAPAATAGKQAWLGILRTNHGSAASAAQVYGLAAEGWDDLAQARDWNPGDGAGGPDNQAMLALLADRWYRLHSQIVRREDPDRLILGDQLHAGPDGLPEFLVPVVSEYTDLLFVAGDVPFATQAESLRLLHQRTDLPVLLASSSPAPGPQEMGPGYADQLRAIMEAGYVVGWHYDGYLDPTAAEGAPRGLVGPLGTVNTDAVTWLAAANQHADIWHARPAR